MVQAIAPPAGAASPAGGVLCVLGAMALFAGLDVAIKSLLETYTVWTLTSARAVIAVVALTPLIVLLGGPHRLLTPFWPSHLARAALFTLGFGVFYASLPMMGVAEISTIFFSAPIMTSLLAALLLGERIGPRRGMALGVGFAGVVIALAPTSDAFRPIALAPLITAATYAYSQVLVRRIGERESSLTMGLYTIGLSGPMVLAAGWTINALGLAPTGAAHLQWAPAALSVDDLRTLALVGGAGAIGFLLLTRAYQIAPASLIAPFDYVYLPIVGVVAFIALGEAPTAATILGMVLIIGSGVALGRAELRAARRARAIGPATAETVFSPGHVVGGPGADAETEYDADWPLASSAGPRLGRDAMRP